MLKKLPKYVHYGELGPKKLEKGLIYILVGINVVWVTYNKKKNFIYNEGGELCFYHKKVGLCFEHPIGI